MAIVYSALYNGTAATLLTAYTPEVGPSPANPFGGVFELDGSGNVLSANVKEGSGFEALDKQALEMVRKASPFPAPPEALRERSFNITVPVSFKLESP